MEIDETYRQALRRLAGELARERRSLDRVVAEVRSALALFATRAPALSGTQEVSNP